MQATKLFTRILSLLTPRNISHSTLRTLMAAMAIIAGSAMLHAESDPLWVQKGPGSLNGQRTNDTYTFVVVDKAYPVMDVANVGGVDLLVDFVSKTYGAPVTSIVATPLSNDPYPEYSIRYTGLDGNDYEIISQRVDEFTKVDNSYIEHPPFMLYQLYAVSKPNVTPVFDSYETTVKYPSKAVTLSLIPGLGQIYKGQTTKGYIIMGGEAALIAATCIFEYKRHDCRKMRDEQHAFESSWNSKINGWRNMRNLGIAAIGGLYVYNLLDAALSNGAPQIVVKQDTSSGVSFMPYASTYETGVAVRYTF